jgi:hypothetical protein
MHKLSFFNFFNLLPSMIGIGRVGMLMMSPRQVSKKVLLKSLAMLKLKLFVFELK